MATYSDLKSDVMNMMNSRGDLVPFIPLCISLAEAEISSVLKSLYQLKTAVLTPDSNSMITLPADYQAFRSVTALTNPRRRLDHIVIGMMDEIVPTRQAGLPSYFSLTANEKILIQPSTTSDIELSYFSRIPALSESNPTNFVLSKSYPTYLYGALKHAAIFISDTDRLPIFSAQFEGNLKILAKQLNTSMYGERTISRNTNVKP